MPRLPPVSVPVAVAVSGFCWLLSPVIVACLALPCLAFISLANFIVTITVVAAASGINGIAVVVAAAVAEAAGAAAAAAC